MLASWSSCFTCAYLGPEAAGLFTGTIAIPGPDLHNFWSFNFFAYEVTMYAAPLGKKKKSTNAAHSQVTPPPPKFPFPQDCHRQELG